MAIQSRSLLRNALADLELFFAESTSSRLASQSCCCIDVLLSKFKIEAIEEVVVQFRLDHSSFLNNDLMPVEDDLRGQIVGLMAVRQDQTVFFAADHQLTYVEVLAVLSDLGQGDRALDVVLLTRNKSGAERKF